MGTSVHLLVCNHAEAEALAILAKADRDFEGVVLSVYPGRCGRPPLASADLYQLAPQDGVAVEVVGSACLSTLRKVTVPDPRYNLNYTQTCFDMFADPQLVAQLVREGAYLLTSGWLATWRERFAAWGFDQDSLRSFLHETTTRVHLLDTGINEDSRRLLAELGEYAECPVGMTYVGLGYFELYLKQIVQRRRLELLSAKAKHDARQLTQKSTDYAMAMDLLAQIASTRDARDAIRRILDVFTMLFAPKFITFVLYEQERPMAMYSPGMPVKPPTSEIVAKLSNMSPRGNLDEMEGTYRIRIAHADHMFGFVLMDQLACPEYSTHYRNLIASIAPICGLALDNARTYQEVSRTGDALKRANRELSRLAVTDALTQVANRRQFDQDLQTEWRRALRRQSPLSLLMIDIDHFKRFNDRWGHQAGDHCLKDVAQTIAGCATRAGDLVARYGGEEFVVILPHTPSVGARLVAEKMRAAVARARIAHGDSPVSEYVTLSIGSATAVPTESAGAIDLVAAADCALYEAKHTGRNRCCAAPEEQSAPVSTL